MPKKKKKNEVITVTNNQFACIEFSEVHAEAVRDIAKALNTNAEALLNLSRVLNGAALIIEGPLLQIDTNK